MAMVGLKNVILAAGLFGISSTGCVSIFNAMANDTSAEMAVIAPEQENSYEPSTEIKVVTYNIAHCRGALTYDNMDQLDQDLTIDSPQQVYKCLDDIAEMLVNEDADIALLQEVDKKAVWSYDIDFMPYLAEKAGMRYYAYGARYDFVWWPFEYQRANGAWIDTVYFNMGNAILSKYPIVSVENKPFDEQSFLDWIAGEEKYLDSVINIEGKNIRVISAHLDSLDSEVRAREALRLANEVRNRGMPTVIGGDFNSILPGARYLMPLDSEMQTDNTMNVLTDSGLFEIYMLNVSPADSRYYTSNTTGLFRTMDYIIPTKDIEIKNYYVVDVELSDHKPVAATLLIGRE